MRDLRRTGTIRPARPASRDRPQAARSKRLPTSHAFSGGAPVHALPQLIVGRLVPRRGAACALVQDSRGQRPMRPSGTPTYRLRDGRPPDRIRSACPRERHRGHRLTPERDTPPPPLACLLAREPLAFDERIAHETADLSLPLREGSSSVASSSESAPGWRSDLHRAGAPHAPRPYSVRAALGVAVRADRSHRGARLASAELVKALARGRRSSAGVGPAGFEPAVRRL